MRGPARNTQHAHGGGGGGYAADETARGARRRHARTWRRTGPRTTSSASRSRRWQRRLHEDAGHRAAMRESNCRMVPCGTARLQPRGEGGDRLRTEGAASEIESSSQILPSPFTRRTLRCVASDESGMGAACSCRCKGSGGGRGRARPAKSSPGGGGSAAAQVDRRQAAWGSPTLRGPRCPSRSRLRANRARKKSWSPRRGRGNKVDMSDKEAAEMDRHARKPAELRAQPPPRRLHPHGRATWQVTQRDGAPAGAELSSRVGGGRRRRFERDLRRRSD